MQNPLKGSLGKALLLLAYPAIQYLTLRVTLHAVLDLRIGFANTTDYDFLIPMPIAFNLLVFVLERGKALELSLRKATLAVNLTAATVFLSLSGAYETLSALFPTTFTALWTLTLVATACSSLFIFIQPTQVLRNPNRAAIVPCLLIGTSLYFYSNGFRDVWQLLGTSTGHAIHALVSFVNYPGIVSYFTPEEVLRIDHAAMSVRIGKGCGGGDAFFFFTLAFLMVAVLLPKGTAFFRSLLVYLGGVAMMFCLNIVRILSLFAIGIWLRKTYGLELGTGIFQMLFHLHLGWILYSVGIYFYLKKTAQVMSAGEQEEPKRKMTFIDAH